ncbi:hypothetical protein D5F01_LYC13568 [Larimichthys crocea]|uniref:Uncharacterized protein n=1 Tax=Larimichthys crocea TaxID=215358 RepID=A0A6G0I883_LARCR|nr:hypothetical protein D5F01_LYC13568 [Larimichthys crocea]
MKGKPGQECSLGIETKVRRGPERKGDKALQWRKTNQRSAVHPHPSHSLSSPLCLTPTSLHKWDALQCCTLRQLPAAVYSPARQEYAGRICYIIRSRQELDGCFSIMLKSLFVYGVLGVLLIPASCDPISVCYEDDNDLRVDCWVEPKANKISSYEFSLVLWDQRVPH